LNENATEINFTQVAKILIDFCDIVLEGSSPAFYATFLVYILEKLSQKWFKNSDGSYTKPPHRVEITFYDNSTVNEAIKRTNSHEPQPTNILYVEERKVYENEHDHFHGYTTAHKICLKENLDDINALGYRTCSAIDNFINGQKFNTMVKVNNADTLQKYTENEEQLFYVGFVISNSKGGVETRLNPAVYRPMFYEKLKDKNGAEKFFNTKDVHSLSEKHSANIDEIFRLNKHWDKPLKDDSELEALEIVTNDVENASAILIRNKRNFYCENLRLTTVIHNMNHIEQLDRYWYLESENLEKFRSGDPELPIDNPLPDEDDLIEYAKRRPLQILLHGKPKVGKTHISKNLASTLDLEFIDFESFLNAFLARVKEGEENIETDDDGNAIEFLNPMERELLELLKSGQRVSTKHMLSLTKQEIKKLKLHLKGFVFELPVYQSPNDDLNYLDLIKEDYFELGNVNCPFNYVINLNYSDQEVIQRTQRVLESNDLENPTLTSRYDREEIVRLKTKAEWQRHPDFEGEADDDLDPDNIIVLNPNDLFMRVNESEFIVKKSLAFYKDRLLPEIEKIVRKLPHTHCIDVDCGSLTPTEILNSIKIKIGEPARVLRPLPIKLEGIDDFPSLLTAEIEEEGRPNRRWSLFNQVDPVELNANNGLVKYGKPEFACEYAGRAFVFFSEENLETFIRNPKPYLLQKPKLPANYNIAIIGMSKSGKSKFAQSLAALYPLKVLEMDQYMTTKIAEQAILEETEHINSNPLNNKIHLTRTQFGDFQRGVDFPIKDILPILLHENNIELHKRPPPPKDEEDLDEEEIAKRLKEEELKKKKKKKKDEVSKNPDEPEPPEDIPLNELVPKPSDAGVVPELRGYVFINFPTSEEQVAAMKEANIPLDAIILLKEGDDDEPGAIVRKRENFYRDAVVENEIAFMEKAVAVLKESYEDVVKDIVMTSEEETFIALRQAVDPFYCRIDDDAFQRPFDRENVDSEVLLYGEYGEYDPVIFRDEGWLLIGSDEFELQCSGRRYRFATEENMAKFKANLPLYVDIQLSQGSNPNDAHKKTILPDLRLFMMGTSGSGIHSQIDMLRKDLKLPIVNLKGDFLKVTEEEKEDRRLDRYYRKGFVEPKYDEDTGAELADEELLEEDEEFDKEKNEIAIMRKILYNSMESCLINSNFFLSEEEEEQIKTPLLELMRNGSRFPEIIIFMHCSEKNMLERKFDEKKITDIYDAKMAEIETLRVEKTKTKLEEMKAERAQKIADGEEIDVEEILEVNPDEIAGDLPEAPDVKEMLAVEKERLVGIRTVQLDKVNELFEQLQEMKIQAFMVDSNRSVEKTYQNIKFAIKDNLENRDAILQRHRVVLLNDSEDKEELTVEKKIIQLEKSYCFKKSRFLDKNPSSLGVLNFNMDHSLIFNDRVYFAKDAEERSNIAKDPLRYLMDRAPPHDIQVNLSKFYYY
jgi:adenylate/nucleoside-diphosphate kinase